jgi:hypothetical protein
MPVHDWTKVSAGIFHDFHHEWISAIKHSLNQTLKGTDYYALAEQVAGGVAPDVLTLQKPTDRRNPSPRSLENRGPGIAVAEVPPKTRFHITNPPLWYATKKKAVAIRHVTEHRVVAVLELILPGNKSSRSALNSFVRKTEELLSAGIHLNVIDLFLPTPRDPEGIHIAIWGEDESSIFRFDPAKPLTCASYIGGVGAEAHVEPFAVGDQLPTIPLFLTNQEYIDVPLESTYMQAFENVPEVWREVLQ